MLIFKMENEVDQICNVLLFCSSYFKHSKYDEGSNFEVKTSQK